MFRRSLWNSASTVALMRLPRRRRWPVKAMSLADQMPTDVFNLGQIETVTITGTPLSQAISESMVDAEEIYRFNALTVDRAIDLVPGAVSGTTGGPRNERLFFIRGFDRFQSTLMVDGIRVYLPADNRLDVGFFPTAKSRADPGPEGLRLGALRSRRDRRRAQPRHAQAHWSPSNTKRAAASRLQATASTTATTPRSSSAARPTATIGRRAAAITKTDHWRLSEDFTPTPSEDGGFRDHRTARNYSANVKFGWTPNATDEYSLSYTGTWGKKNATLSTIDPSEPAEELALALLGCPERLFPVEHRHRRHRLCPNQALLQQLPQRPLRVRQRELQLADHRARRSGPTIRTMPMAAASRSATISATATR